MNHNEPTNCGKPACRPHSNGARRPLRRLYRKQLGVAGWIACRYYFLRAGWLSPIGGDVHDILLRQPEV